MIVGVRGVLTGLAAGLVVSVGVVPGAPAFAGTPTPTPAATASTGVTASPGADDGDAPDLAPDNSRQAWALGGAGVVALVAAGAVFLRRR